MAKRIKPVKAEKGDLKKTAMATKAYNVTKKDASIGTYPLLLPFINSFPIPLFLNINKVKAAVHIPKLSKNIVNPKILSTPFPIKIMIIVKIAKMDSAIK